VQVNEKGETIVKWMLRVYVDKWSKNDDERLGHTRMIPMATHNNDICPVRWFRQYTTMCTKDQEYLFPTASKTKMSADTPNGRLKVMLRGIGLIEDEVKKYGFHSCRRGGETRANEVGISTYLLKRHGNWKSDTVFVYIDDSIEQKRSVRAGIIDGRK
jgi:hypothetical protein